MKPRPHNERLVFYSRLAFYPIHLEAYKYLCSHYDVCGTIIANSPPDIPTVHQQLGWGDSQTIDYSSDIRIVPEADRAVQARWLKRHLCEVRPDVIWVQEEPTDYFLFRVLRAYFLKRSPRIVTAVCENSFPSGPLLVRLIRKVLWWRLNGLLAVATASLEGIRAAGMPAKVPASTLVAGALPPPEAVEPMELPFMQGVDDFIVGFAGRICEEKGWKVLLTALLSLPASVKCLIAGDGPQISEIHSWISNPVLQGRVFYMGLLPKAKLWSFYRALDCLVIPSLTFPHWKEQFGGVLADGMAMGLPLIGSDSGAIPEVIGPAGLVVPENRSDVLAAAIRRLREDASLRRKLGDAGRQRFWTEFAIPAYARKIAAMLQLKER